MRVSDHCKISSEVDSCNKNRLGVAVMTMPTREVDPGVVMFFDISLEGKSPFDIFSVGFVFSDQRRALLLAQFECKLGARFHGTFVFMSASCHKDNHRSHQGIAAEAPTSAPISLTVLVRR